MPTLYEDLDLTTLLTLDTGDGATFEVASIEGGASDGMAAIIITDASAPEPRACCFTREQTLAIVKALLIAGAPDFEELVAVSMARTVLAGDREEMPNGHYRSCVWSWYQLEWICPPDCRVEARGGHDKRPPSAAELDEWVTTAGVPPGVLADGGDIDV